MLLSEALSDYMYEEDSDAVKQAQQMGLVYKGFGRWADPQTNKVTHKTERGQLVPVDPGQQELPLGTPKVEPHKGIPGAKVDMPHGDPRQTGFNPQPPTEELPSQKEKAQKLTTMLKNHDWHHQYSDDYSVVKRGQLEKKAIQQYIQGSGIDPQLAQKVYDKFAHPDYQGKGQEFGIQSQQPTGREPIGIDRNEPTQSGKARDQMGRDITKLKKDWPNQKQIVRQAQKPEKIKKDFFPTIPSRGELKAATKFVKKNYPGWYVYTMNVKDDGSMEVEIERERSNKRQRRERQTITIPDVGRGRYRGSVQPLKGGDSQKKSGNKLNKLKQVLSKISSRMGDKDIKRVFQTPEFEKILKKSLGQQDKKKIK